MIKNIFPKNQITLLVFPLCSGFCPKFRTLMIFYNSNICLIVLKSCIIFNSNPLCIWRIFFNIRKLINSLSAFDIILFELVFIWIIWINMNLLMVSLSWRCRSTSNNHSVIFWSDKWGRIVLLNKSLILLCNEAWRGCWIKIVLFLI